MTLIFARHGQSEANVLQIISNRDVPHALTELGRIQAAQMAEQLGGAGITRIYASPILRAKQTAEIVGVRLDCAVEVTDLLREFDCGVAEGRGDDDAWRMHHDVISAWREQGDLDARIEGGESFNDLRAWFVPFVDGLKTRHAHRTVLCISHGSMLGLMLPLVLDNVSLEWASAHAIGNCSPIYAEHRGDGLTCIEWCAINLCKPGSTP